MKKNRLILPAMAAGLCLTAFYGFASKPGKNIIDEVVWVVGDEAIFRSDVEEMYQDMRNQGAVTVSYTHLTLPTIGG